MTSLEYIQETISNELHRLTLKERKALLEDVGVWLNNIMAIDYREYDKMQKNIINDLREENSRLAEENENLVEKNQSLNKENLEQIARYNLLLEKCSTLLKHKVQNFDTLSIEKAALMYKVQQQKRMLTESNAAVKKYKDRLNEVLSAR